MMGRIGGSELLLILGIALVIFGPKQLPELGKIFGKTIGSIKRYASANTWEEEAAREEAAQEGASICQTAEQPQRQTESVQEVGKSAAADAVPETRKADGGTAI